MHLRNRRGFTLIELLVVIAVIAILSVVVILVLNPADLLRQSRDSTRLSDAATLKSALGVYAEDIGGSMGSSSVVYVSIPDPLATSTAGDQCQGLGLSSIGSTTYHCASSANYRNVNGTGWIPINFKSISSGVPIGSLPVDPSNATSTAEYYTYQTNGTLYEVTMEIESSKYVPYEVNDGGNYADLYEVGTSFNLSAADFCSIASSCGNATGRAAFNVGVPVTIAASTPLTYTFFGSAGQLVNIAGTSTFFNNLNIALLSPSSSTVASVNTAFNSFNMNNVSLPLSGLYTIAFNSVSSGTAAFYLTQQITSPIALNTPLFANMNNYGQTYLYTFSGTAGQIINIAGTSTIFNGLNIALVSPSGTTVNSINDGFNIFAMNNVTLPSTGQYSISLNPGQYPGTAATYLTQLIVGPIAFNTATSSNMTNYGQTYEYTFTGSPGLVISISGVSTIFNALNISLISPTGTTITSVNDGFNAFSIGSTTLTASGTYQIMLNPGAYNGMTTTTLSM